MNEASYRKKLWTVYGPKQKPMLTIEQEIAEIKARHERQREYNRVRNAAKRLAARIRGPHHAISRDVVDQPHD